MGYTNNELIPAAVLLDNSGITREEFISRLQGVRYSEDRGSVKDEQGRETHSVLRDFPWNLEGCSDLYSSIPNNDSAIFRFAEVLRIKKRKEHIEKLKSLEKKDELYVEGRISEFYGFDDTWGDPWLWVPHSRDKKGTFEVSTNQPSYLTGETQFGRFRGCGGHREGDIVLTTDTGAKFYPFKIRRFAKDYGDEQLLQIEEVKTSSKTEIFTSLEELLEEHPYFDPDFMFDWDQTNGELSCGFRSEQFKWKKENGKYFFDWETFTEIRGTSVEEDGRINPLVLTYTGLILTAEAIRKRAWKLLSAYGLNYMDEFLTTFPDSKRRYDFAVKDAFYSFQDLQNGKIDSEEFVRRSKAVIFIDD